MGLKLKIPKVYLDVKKLTKPKVYLNWDGSKVKHTINMPKLVPKLNIPKAYHNWD